MSPKAAPFYAEYRRLSADPDLARALRTLRRLGARSLPAASRA
ncbi:MAG TPA: hypothetical protein PK452_06715 [Amaricoccus sp.]|nr:hypothetical protein [Amaricoccus sp.]HRO11210.1 hypothetical protein [Amaricoccus sp.]